MCGTKLYRDREEVAFIFPVGCAAQTGENDLWPTLLTVYFIPRHDVIKVFDNTRPNSPSSWLMAYTKCRQQAVIAASSRIVVVI